MKFIVGFIIFLLITSILDKLYPQVLVWAKWLVVVSAVILVVSFLVRAETKRIAAKEAARIAAEEAAREETKRRAEEARRRQSKADEEAAREETERRAEEARRRQSNQGRHNNSRNETPPHSSQITREQAYNILNLHANASKQEIIDAHRKFINKNHPDRGGSDYLAAQINKAKDILLND